MRPWITRPGAGVAALFTALAYASVRGRIGIEIPGTAVLTDPREVLVLLGAALAGPVAAPFIGIASGLWSTDPGLIPFGAGVHAAAALGAAFLYRPLATRVAMPRFVVGWIAIVAIYYLAFSPLILIGLHAFAPATFARLVGPGAPWPGVLGDVLAGWLPEFGFTAVVTSAILIALPARLRRPLWGPPVAPPSAPTPPGALGLRLALWIILLALMPVVLRQLGWLPAEFLSIAIVLVAVAAVIVIWLLVARPLRDLTQALRRLTEGQRDARVDPAAMDDDLRVLGVAFNELALAIGDSERGLRDLHVELEARVAARTAELADLNRELQQFTSSASHDLAAPLRAIAGFATALEEDHGAALGDDGRATLTRIRAAAGRADELLHGLLALAKVGRHELDRVEVDVTTLAREVVAELRERDPGRAVDVVVADGLRAEADRVLLRAALINLLGNAWKFTGRVAAPRVELAAATLDDRPAFVVRDNGAGFDMAHAAKLAQPFARLHSVSEFPGSGIGLATVRRIVERHGGRLHGEGVVGAGATFTFSL